MNVERRDDALKISIGPAPAILIAFEFEASPRVFVSGEALDQAVGRIIADLTPRWRAVLGALAEAEGFPVDWDAVGYRPGDLANGEPE